MNIWIPKWTYKESFENVAIPLQNIHTHKKKSDFSQPKLSSDFQSAFSLHYLHSFSVFSPQSQFHFKPQIWPLASDFDCSAGSHLNLKPSALIFLSVPTKHFSIDPCALKSSAIETGQGVLLVFFPKLTANALFLSVFFFFKLFHCRACFGI